MRKTLWKENSSGHSLYTDKSLQSQEEICDVHDRAMELLKQAGMGTKVWNRDWVHGSARQSQHHARLSPQRMVFTVTPAARKCHRSLTAPIRTSRIFMLWSQGFSFKWSPLMKNWVGCPTLEIPSPRPALPGRLGLGSHTAFSITEGNKVKYGSVTAWCVSAYRYLYPRCLDHGVTLLEERWESKPRELFRVKFWPHWS